MPKIPDNRFNIRPPVSPVELARGANPGSAIGHVSPAQGPLASPAEIARRVNQGLPIGYVSKLEEEPPAKPDFGGLGRILARIRAFTKKLSRKGVAGSAMQSGILLFSSAGAIAANGSAPLLSVSATLASGAGLAGFGALPSGSFNLPGQLCHGICNLFPTTVYPIF